MRRLATVGASVCVAAALAGGCGGEPEGGGPGSLEALLRDLVAANVRGDTARVREITFSVIPTTDDLRQVVRPGPDADAFVARYEPKDLRPDDPRLQGVAFAGAREVARTEVFVHRATTEEIARYERGSVAHAEFPGGMRRFAEKVAAPGRTWWTAELREPGKPSGTRYTCFTRLGDRWLLIVKPWRSMPSDARPADDTPQGR